MSRIVYFNRSLVAAVAVSTALCLAGCGGSSKAVSQTSSQTSTASSSSSQSSTTQSSGSSSPTQSGSSTTTTQSTTTATPSVSEARTTAAREHAIKMYAKCLSKHAINPKATVETPEEKPVVTACLAAAEAYFKAATRPSK